MSRHYLHDIDPGEVPGDVTTELFTYGIQPTSTNTPVDNGVESPKLFNMPVIIVSGLAFVFGAVVVIGAVHHNKRAGGSRQKLLPATSSKGKPTRYDCTIDTWQERDGPPLS